MPEVPPAERPLEQANPEPTEGLGFNGGVKVGKILKPPVILGPEFNYGQDNALDAIEGTSVVRFHSSTPHQTWTERKDHSTTARPLTGIGAESV